MDGLGESKNGNSATPSTPADITISSLLRKETDVLPVRRFPPPPLGDAVDLALVPSELLPLLVVLVLLLVLLLPLLPLLLLLRPLLLLPLLLPPRLLLLLQLLPLPPPLPPP
jgi:hypothetical protein